MRTSLFGVEKSLRTRLIILFLIASFIATIFGTMTPVAYEEAKEVYKEFVESSEYISTAQFIFGNNFLHCLVMFVPAVGPVYGLYIMYNTGVMLKMFAVAQGVDVFLAFLGVFLFPFAWMEYIAYALAMSQSVLSLESLLKKQAMSELVRMCVWIAVCAVILLAAAAIEALLLAQWGGNLELPPK